MIIETLGGWEDEAVEVVRRLGVAQATRLGTEPSQAIPHLFQRLGVALWRGNGLMWARRTVVTPEVDGVR